MLRDHEIFRSPLAVDRSRLITKPWPPAWGSARNSKSIEVLPLIDKEAEGNRPGWCTYAESMSDSPEVEIFCGGVNDKAATAAAIWRQGNLLHFGFEPGPDEMNESGRSLLIDSIVYIARFTDDRPIAWTPSGMGDHRASTRARIERHLTIEDEDHWTMLFQLFVPATLNGANVHSFPAFRAWYREFGAYLHPAPEGRLDVDKESHAMQLPPGRLEFFSKAIAALATQGEESARARRVLARYAPDGPGSMSEPRDWRDWLDANRDYLFFSESGGYRWYVDPLAKARKIPTAKLRGPARASRR